MKMKKAQTAIEFILLMGFILFFFVTFLGVLNKNQYEKTYEQQRIALKNNVENIQKEITMAWKSSNGYQRKFSIPEKILNLEYNVSIQQEMIYAITEDKKHAIAVSVPKTNGSIQKGENTVRKLNDTIFLNP